jgi:hypothetical protein
MVERVMLPCSKAERSDFHFLELEIVKKKRWRNMDAPPCTSLCKGVARPLRRAITIWSKSRTILAKWEKKAKL